MRVSSFFLLLFLTPIAKSRHTVTFTYESFTIELMLAACSGPLNRTKTDNMELNCPISSHLADTCAMPSQRHNVVVSLILLCVGFARGQTTPNALNPCANPSSYLPNLMLDPANNITCAVAAALYLTPFTGTDISTVQCSFLPNYPTNCCNTVKMIVGYLAGTVGCCFGGTGTNYTPAPCIET